MTKFSHDTLAWVFFKNQEDERKHPNSLPVAISIESSRTFWFRYQSRWANNCHNRTNIIMENARCWIKVRGTAWWPSSSSAVSHRQTISVFLFTLFCRAYPTMNSMSRLSIIITILLLRCPLPLARYHLNVMGIIKKLLLKVFGCKKQVLQRVDLLAYVTRSFKWISILFFFIKSRLGHSELIEFPSAKTHSKLFRSPNSIHND